MANVSATSERLQEGPRRRLFGRADRWRGPGPRTRRLSLPYLLLAPIVLFELIFVVYPVLRGILLAFQANNAGVTSWVGLSNFQNLAHDPGFWTSMRVTFQFTLCMVVLWLTLGLGLALLMNWSFKGRGVVRAILAIPWAVPDIPIVLTFLIMLDPNFGIINRFASLIPGVHHQIQWLSSPTLAFVTIVMMVGWKGFPFYALILLTSLQSIPDVLYEAATVDGAGPFRRLVSITLPSLASTLALLAVLAFIFSFQQFSLIYLSTGGGPGADTSTMSVRIYLQAFEFFNYNYASAIAVVGLVIAMTATLLFVVVERRVIRTQYVEAGAAAL